MRHRVLNGWPYIHRVLYTGNLENGWPYISRGGLNWYALLEAFEVSDVLIMQADPWCDVPFCRRMLNHVRSRYPHVRIGYLIQGPNGWGGAAQRARDEWGSEAWVWAELLKLREKYPLVRQDGTISTAATIDMRRAYKEFNVLTDRIMDGGNGEILFVDHWNQDIRWLGFPADYVDPAEWRDAMNQLTPPRGAELWVNTGGWGRTEHASTQLFEHWPYLPPGVGYPQVKNMVLPGDMLAIMAPQVYQIGVSPNADTQAKAAFVYSDALSLGCYAAVTSPIIKPDGRVYAYDRGHSPWRF